MIMQPSHNRIAHQKARRDSLEHPDPYRDHGKHVGKLACTQCHVVYEAGRWHWADVPAAAVPTLCPACRRVRDRYAAHVLKLDNVPRNEQREVLGVLHDVAEVEREEHPLERLMLVRHDGNSIEAATTGVHIARRLLANVLRRYRQRVQVRHGNEITQIRWQ